MTLVPAERPVTTPVVLTVATAVLVLDQVPPDAASVRVILALVHTRAGPLMQPAVGVRFTVTGAVVSEVPQELLTEYVMVTLPVVMPVTTPDELTVATVLLELIQVPPLTLGVRVMLLPVHTDEGPVRLPAGKDELTVTTMVAWALPQVLVTVYIIVSVPALIPPTRPELFTVAKPLVALQVPPLTVGVRVMPEPMHTKLVPPRVPALGNGRMVVVAVATDVPQPVVTE